MASLISMLGLVALLALALGPAMAGARQGGGKPLRLHAPEHVTCTRTVDQVTVTWSPVVGALQYRVMFEAEGGEGELMTTAPASPYTASISEIADDPAIAIDVKVRAMQSAKGKGASKPSAKALCQ